MRPRTHSHSRTHTHTHTQASLLRPAEHCCLPFRLLTKHTHNENPADQDLIQRNVVTVQHAKVVAPRFASHGAFVSVYNYCCFTLLYREAGAEQWFDDNHICVIYKQLFAINVSGSDRKSEIRGDQRSQGEGGKEEG
jgi:hypothetical protein